jgi:hypothetical protein
LHAVDGLVLEEQLIVLGDGDKEEDGRHILKAVNPLLSFRSLSTNVEHSVGQVLDDEGGFRDTSGLDTRSQDILVIGKIIVGSNSFDRVEIAGTRSVLIRAQHRRTHYRAESLS